MHVWNKIILRVFLCLLSFFLAFGKVDPILSSAPISSIYLMLIIFVSLFSYFYWRETLSTFPKESLYLIAILFVFFSSSVLYGYSIFTISVFNLKFLLCIVLFSVLTVFFKEDPKSVYYTAIFFGISSFIFSIYVGLNPELTEIRNGRFLIADENPNSTGSRLSIAIAFLLYFSLENLLNLPKLVRLILVIMCIPILSLILSSGSRGAVVTLAFSLSVYFYYADIKSRYKFYIAILLLLVPIVFSGYFLQFETIIDRLTSSVVSGDSGGREEIWLDVFSIVENNYFIGVGEPGYLHEIYKIRHNAIDTHNLFLYVLVCGGGVSLFFLIMFNISLIRKVLKELKYKNVLPLLIYTNATLISVRTGGVITYLLLWYLYAIVASFKTSKLQNKA